MKYDLEPFLSKLEIHHQGFRILLPNDPAIPKGRNGEHFQVSGVETRDIEERRGEQIAKGLLTIQFDGAIVRALVNAVASRKLVYGKGKYAVRDPVMMRDEVSKKPGVIYYASSNIYLHGNEIYHNGGVIWVRRDMIHIDLNPISSV